MSLEASTTNPMYTTEIYKSVTVNEESIEAGNAALRGNPEVRGEVSAESGTEQMEFAEDWSQKWIQIENSV